MRGAKRISRLLANFLYFHLQSPSMWFLSKDILVFPIRESRHQIILIRKSRIAVKGKRNPKVGRKKNTRKPTDNNKKCSCTWLSISTIDGSLSLCAWFTFSNSSTFFFVYFEFQCCKFVPKFQINISLSCQLSKIPRSADNLTHRSKRLIESAKKFASK